MATTITEVGVGKVNYANITITPVGPSATWFAGIFLTGASAKETWKKNEVMQSDGTFGGEDARAVSIQLDVDYEMTATSRALAAVAGGFMIPLTECVIVGDLAWLNAAGDTNARYQGHWLYIEGGSRDLSPEKTGKGKMSFRKYADNAENLRQFVQITS
jgi:hypothetical protein